MFCSSPTFHSLNFVFDVEHEVVGVDFHLERGAGERLDADLDGGLFVERIAVLILGHLSGNEHKTLLF